CTMDTSAKRRDELPSHVQTATHPTRRRDRASVTGRRLFRDLAILLVGALLTVLLQFAATFVTQPDRSDIDKLLQTEIQAAVSRDAALAASIFSPDATIEDSGCITHASPQVWNGSGEIRTRYAHLPEFILLQHADLSVTWRTNFRFA